MGKQRVREALDRCLTRMRQGEALEQCLADFPELAEALRPLLQAALELKGLPEEPVPLPPSSLRAGRGRLLATAEALRQIEAEAAEEAAKADEQAQANGHAALSASETAAPSDHDLAERLDQTLARIAAGEDPVSVLDGETGDEAAVLRRLSAMAQRLRIDVEPAPPAEDGLAKGRARFLALGAALAENEEEAKTHHAAEVSSEAALLNELIDQRAGASDHDSLLEGLPADKARELAPLLALASRLEAATKRSPEPSEGFEAHRARMLALAEALRLNAAEAALDAGSEASASVETDTLLDETLSEVAAGASSAALIEAMEQDEAEAVEPLLSLTEIMGNAIATAPPAPAGLEAGRARFLDVAAKSAAHREAVASATVSAEASVERGERKNGVALWLAGLAGTFVSGSRAARVAGAAMAAFVVFMGSSLMLETQASAALPGDALYPIKRINENVELLLAPISGRSVQSVRDTHNNRRAVEAELLRAAGGPEREIEVSGKLDGFSSSANAQGKPSGTIGVRIPNDDGDDHLYTYGWEDDTRFKLGAWSDMGRVPRGSRIKLQISTSSSVLGHAKAKSVSVVDQPAQEPTITPTLAVSPTLSVSNTATIVPRMTEPALPEPSATASPTQGRATLTPQPSPTVAATATEIVLTPVDQATATVERPPRNTVNFKQIRARVLAMPAGTGIWLVREDGSRAELKVNIEKVPADEIANVSIGDVVKISYRQDSDPLDAVHIKHIDRGENLRGCDGPFDKPGTIADFKDGRLFLTSGDAYTVDENTVREPSTLGPGDVVLVHYEICGDVQRAIRVEGMAPPEDDGPPVDLEGTIENLSELGDGRWRFTLEGRDVVTIERTRIELGRFSGLADGQTIMLEGFERGNGTVVALQIIVLAGPDPVVPTDPTAPAPGGDAEAPTPTPFGPPATATPAVLSD